MQGIVRADLIKKYRWAGKIRFTSFLIFFLFLVLLKTTGGYDYLNPAVVAVMFFEAFLNQPYGFLLKKSDPYRLQFYQMVADIISISWLLYYMGGLEAPLVKLGYYVVVLWAGVVSDTLAVFFAVIASCVMFSAVVILEYFGLFPKVSYLHVQIPMAQFFSLLLGEVSFLFAFGYFTARSSVLIKFLERSKQEESLRQTHKFLAAGQLIAGIAHDVVNHLIVIRAYADTLLEKASSAGTQDAGALARIKEAEEKSARLLERLLKFSQNPKEKFKPLDVNEAVEEALGLTVPLLQLADVRARKKLAPGLPGVLADKDRLQEVFVMLILSAAQGLPAKSVISVATSLTQDAGSLEAVISNAGQEQGQKRQVTFEPLLSPDAGEEDRYPGLFIVSEILLRHKGSLEVVKHGGREVTFAARLPVIGKGAGDA